MSDKVTKPAAPAPAAPPPVTAAPPPATAPAAPQPGAQAATHTEEAQKVAEARGPVTEPVKAVPAMPSKDGDNIGQIVPFSSAAETDERMQHDEGQPRTEGLSMVSGLVEVGSSAPAMADGTAVPHMMGPGQAAVDPIAAGLDYLHKPATRNEVRQVTRTGVVGSGPRPATYVEKGVDAGGDQVVSDGSTVPAGTEAEASQAPGPSSGHTS